MFRPYYPVSKLYRVVDDDAGLQIDFMPVLHGVRSFASLRSRAERLVLGMPLAPEPRVNHLVEIGRWLALERYSFITTTPLTHRRVVDRRPGALACSVRDVFGWSLPFDAGLLPARIVDCLRQANALEEGPPFRSRVRYSTLGEQLYVHSAFPTDDVSSVFFGPDTYRFCRFLEGALPRSVERLVDVGCGSGAGGISVAGRTKCVVLADINAEALRFSCANAQLAGLRESEVVQSDVLANLSGPIDAIISNPPYLADPKGRAYRDGGGELGTGLGVRILSEGLARIERGVICLYTGSPVHGGKHVFRAQAERLLLPEAPRGVRWTYEELDPDVFGEELEQPQYRAVERIAAVGLTVHVRM